VFSDHIEKESLHANVSRHLGMEGGREQMALPH
jgi:hypothetical protein